MTEKSSTPLIESISINQLLPLVFCGMEADPSISSSEVWLRELKFTKGKKTLVQAESGKGKSSLISFIYGRRTDYSGVISFDGNDIRNLSIHRWCELRCRSLAWLPQEMALFDEMTAIENIRLKNSLTGFHSEEWIRDAFLRLEIDNRMDSPVRFLSVGQQQRVAILRALCQPMDFLLLDEPVSHLDARTNALVAQLVNETLSDTGAGLIVTSVGNHLSVDFDNRILL